MTWLRNHLRVRPVAMTEPGRFDVVRVNLIGGGLIALSGNSWLVQTLYVVVALPFLWTLDRQERDSL